MEKQLKNFGLVLFAMMATFAGSPAQASTIEEGFEPNITFPASRINLFGHLTLKRRAYFEPLGSDIDVNGRLPGYTQDAQKIEIKIPILRKNKPKFDILSSSKQEESLLSFALAGSSSSGLILETKKVVELNPEDALNISAKLYGSDNLGELTIEADYVFNNKVSVGAKVFERKNDSKSAAGLDGIAARIEYFMADYFSINFSYSSAEHKPIDDPTEQGKTWLFGGNFSF